MTRHQAPPHTACGEAHFRIRGPGPLTELDNAEDDADHAESVRRDPSNGFGAVLLIQHHLEHGHSAANQHRGA